MELQELRIRLTAERERHIASALIGMHSQLLGVIAAHPDIASAISAQLDRLNGANTWEKNLAEVDKLIALVQGAPAKA